MKISRPALAVIAATVAALSFGAGHAEPSDSCEAGPLGAAGSPAGVGVGQAGEDLIVCNNGTVVPAPAKGAVTLHGDSESQQAYIEVDGDSDNSGAACADGFVRVAVDDAGYHFYQSPDGDYLDTIPGNSGGDRANEQEPDAWAQSIAENCGS